MIDATSRYAGLEKKTYVGSDGQQIVYVSRRMLPQGATMPLLVEIQVRETDRLDLISFRTLGDPELSWRIADANNAMNPFDLTDQVGQTVRVPIPQAQS